MYDRYQIASKRDLSLLERWHNSRFNNCNSLSDPGHKRVYLSLMEAKSWGPELATSNVALTTCEVKRYSSPFGFRG
jgi:hypothetical protein